MQDQGQRKAKWSRGRGRVRSPRPGAGRRPARSYPRVRFSTRSNTGSARSITSGATHSAIRK